MHSVQCSVANQKIANVEWKQRQREFKLRYIRDRDSVSAFGNKACPACKECIQSTCTTCPSCGVVCKQVGAVNMGRFKEPVMTISNQTATELLVAQQDALETRDECDHEVEAIVESRGPVKSKSYRIKWMGYPLNTPHYPQWLLAADLHDPETGECLCPVALEEFRSKKDKSKSGKK